MSDFDALAAARTILPDIAALSQNSELNRRVDDAAIAAMAAAGLARLLTPRKYGGHELPPSAQIQTCMITASACSAASWVHMVCGAHTFVAARFSEQCCDEVFAAGPDVLIPGTLAPQGEVVRTNGGWRLNGRWQFGSGVGHGPWLLLGAMGEKDDAGNRAPPRHVIVPADDIQVDDTWYSLGLRGSGSQDLLADDVFVPDHRSMPTVPLFMGTFESTAGPLYRLPVMGGLASMLAGTVVGMAETGLSRFVDANKVRRDVYMGNAKAAKVGIQMRVAEAGGELAAARRLVEENCDLLDAAMAANELPLDVPARMRIRWNAAYAVELCRRATDRIYAAAGAHAIYDHHPLQRLYRDMNTACHHAIVDFDGVAELKGRVELGLEDGVGLV
jgi:alkylation response protein AidB-like acyl-CoA dehydrogenase